MRFFDWLFSKPETKAPDEPKVINPKAPEGDHAIELALPIIQKFEGFRTKAYQCSAGVWTIGWGTTEGVKKGDAITRSDAEKRLCEYVAKSQKDITRLVEVPLNDYQEAALLSFVYNIGINGFAKSTLLKKLNRRDYAGAANEFRRWNKAGGVVLAGLVKRRKAEAELFLTKE